MEGNDLKKEIIKYIESTDDEALLSLLKEDLVFYGKVKGVDILDNLSEEQINELKALSDEDEIKESHNLQEFKNATQKWRTK